ncbi:hypothetical protein ACJBUA_12170, partial [Streptococcus suis]
IALYDDLAGELAENPVFLADYVAVLRQLGRLDESKEQASRYIQLVPDDLAMQEFLNEEYVMQLNRLFQFNNLGALMA